MAEVHTGADSLLLWESAPAERLVDAHLLGNGRLGAAVFGALPDERIVINEDTLWSGSESFLLNPDTRALLPEARRLVFERKFAEAHRLVAERMLGGWGQAYEPLGTLHVVVGLEPRAGSEFLRRMRREPPQGYRRSLDLDSAVATVEYREGGRNFRRECFVSAPDQVVALRLSVDSGTMDLAVILESELRHAVSTQVSTLLLSGRAPDWSEPDYSSARPFIVYLPEEDSASIRFAASVRVVETDGRLTSTPDRLLITGARHALVLLAAHTNYEGYGKERSRDVGRVVSRCLRTLDGAGSPAWDQLRERHLADHRAFFRRVDISIGPSTTSVLPTSRRLAFQAGASLEDPSFAALALQYTRYLLIASSRPGTQAANLQGIWNDRVRPPWSSNLTTNINVEMNYWGAEVLGLPECHEPLFDMVAEAAESGKHTAREWYGLDGWVAHHNIDLWRKTTPCAGLPSWSWWPMAAGWLCQHLWRHVEYTGDTEFLARRAYPLIEEAARFFLGLLVEDEEGYLSTAPSTSPENNFFVDQQAALEADFLLAMSPENRMAVHQRTSAVAKSSTMDLSIIREVFEHCLRGADMLGRRGELHQRIERSLERLYPFKVGRHGQLQEWCFDFAECMPGMGHVSHMYGLFPGELFTPQRNPDLYEACRKSMFRRFAHGAFKWGWPAAWSVSLFARLKERAQAGQMVRESCRSLGANLMTEQHLQLDCAFGLGAGIAEMLLQSHDGSIELLPAVPGSWAEGRVGGLRARGGFEVSFQWRLGTVTRCEVRSTLGGPCRIHGPGLRSVELSSDPGKIYQVPVRDE
ncbi:MAG: glycoside hydrolase family 95 protein [Spirochaetes bacterium]|nr:glycoside hydrolase family 95 protein [Spirochaetota bacterium]